MVLIRDLPASERPRERLNCVGADKMHDWELLAVVLGTGARGLGPAATAQQLLVKFSSLRRMSFAGVAELMSVPGIGLAQASRIRATLALAARLSAEPFQRGDRIAGPADVYERVGRRLRLLEREMFCAISLDAKHRVVGEHRLAEGGVCSVDVLPRDVFAAIVREAAVACVFVHNHPSGDPEPSDADRDLTERLIGGGRLVGVQMLDHIIVGHDAYYSFAEDQIVAID